VSVGDESPDKETNILKSRFTQFALLFVLLFAWSSGIRADTQVGYGYSDDGTPAGGSLNSVNLETGIASQIGDLDRKTTGSFRLNNLVFAPNGNAYGYQDDGTPAGTSLYSVDVLTGIASLIGDLDGNSTSSFRLENLVFAPDGNAYGYHEDGTPAGTSLYWVDVVTGIASFIGNLDRNTSSSFRLDNLVFAPNGNAYGYRDDGTPAGTSLYSVNVATGIATLIGDLDRSTSSAFRLENLVFGSDGTGYGYRDDGTPAGTSLYSVNVVTGVATEIGNLDRKTVSSFRLDNLVLGEGTLGYGYRDDGTSAGTSLYSVNVTTGIAKLIGDLDRKTVNFFRLDDLSVPTSNIALSPGFFADIASSPPELKANDDTGTTVEGKMLVIDVLANDDGLGSGPTVFLIDSEPTGGSASVTAEFKVMYTPAAEFSGVDSFRYSVSDRDGASSTATVTVIIATAPTFRVVSATETRSESPNLATAVGAGPVAGEAAQEGAASGIGPVSALLLLLVASGLRRERPRV
jgi:hypothetical protein